MRKWSPGSEGATHAKNSSFLYYYRQLILSDELIQITTNDRIQSTGENNRSIESACAIR